MSSTKIHKNGFCFWKMNPGKFSTLTKSKTDSNYSIYTILYRRLMQKAKEGLIWWHKAFVRIYLSCLNSINRMSINVYCPFNTENVKLDQANSILSHSTTPEVHSRKNSDCRFTNATLWEINSEQYVASKIDHDFLQSVLGWLPISERIYN